MPAKKKIPVDELPLRAAESAARILKMIQSAIDTQEVAQEWIDDLIEILAKRECKRRCDLPAWSKLTSQQKDRLLKGAKETLLTIHDFWQEKVAVQEK
jgi:hypothetical protein